MALECKNNHKSKHVFFHLKLNHDSYISALFCHILTLFNFLDFFMSFTFYNLLVKDWLLLFWSFKSKNKVKKFLKQNSSKHIQSIDYLNPCSCEIVMYYLTNKTYKILWKTFYLISPSTSNIVQYKMFAMVTLCF